MQPTIKNASSRATLAIRRLPLYFGNRGCFVLLKCFPGELSQEELNLAHPGYILPDGHYIRSSRWRGFDLKQVAGPVYWATPISRGPKARLSKVEQEGKSYIRLTTDAHGENPYHRYYRPAFAPWALWDLLRYRLQDRAS